MKALLDADMLLYEYGSLKDDEGNPLKWPFVKERLDARIKGIVNKVEADEYTLFITGKGNFRVEEATILPYKGNRADLEKPYWYQSIKDMFTNSKMYPCEVVEGYEADDAMSILQYTDPENVIICSRDKDLNMVPGKHYSWAVGDQKPKEPFVVTEVEGWANFFKQMLIGDSVDNILGLYNVGPKSVAVQYVTKECVTTQMMYDRVQKEYESRFGNYWKQFMDETARLLWMLRTPDDDIRKDLNEFEQRRTADIPF